jgi:hypothetical protein
MEIPKAPSWFRKKLKEFDPRLTVTYNSGARAWDISEKIKYVTEPVYYKGIKIAQVKERLERVTQFPSLGSRIFNILNELKTVRFKNYYEMMNKLKLQGYQDLYNKVSVCG